MVVRVQDIIDYLCSAGHTVSYGGNVDAEVSGFSSLSNYKPGTVTWVKSEGSLESIDEITNVQAVIVEQGVRVPFKNAIITDRSKAAFFSVLEEFFSSQDNMPRIGEGTYISSSVKLGEHVRIGHNCTLDGNITIGDGTIVYNNVVIVNSAAIGKNCIIQSGVSIGHDGFAYTEDTNHKKTMVKHYGGVEIGDDVYIGSNTCIERGTIDNTIIGSGTKIDMCCLVGHNSVIGDNCAMVAGSMLLGSVKLENNSYIASALIRNQCKVGENGFVGLGSVVTKDVPRNATVVGVPAKAFDK